MLLPEAPHPDGGQPRFLRLWTIQPREVYENWRPKGVFRSDADRVDPDFRRPYQWLADQMQARLPAAPVGCRFPIWAWFQAHSANRPRPDLRTSGFLRRGKQAVLLTLKVEEQLVLLSDFDLWHYVLNDWYLPPDANMREAGATTVKQRQDSWMRIFDLDFQPPGIADPPEQKILQATFWELATSQVVHCQPFTAR